jgi:MerR family transcriptional regulator/heat shock protein HspR
MTKRTPVAVFVFSVAAELADMHPQTLRSYEKKGLLSPSRTPGGTRRYSQEDIEQLLIIQELSDRGLNSVGIKLVLGLREQVQQLTQENQRLRKRFAQLRADLPTAEQSYSLVLRSGNNWPWGTS